MKPILDGLVELIPEAIGAILCDFDGETVVSALGEASIPEEAQARAMEHVPKQIPLEMPIAEFLIRLAGAEPCALLRLADQTGRRHAAGAVRSLQLCYEKVEILVEPLPSDYYVVLILRRPALASHARFHLHSASRQLSEFVG